MYKDILTPVIAIERDEAALRAASQLAQRFEAHATALLVAVHLASDFQQAPHTLSDVLADVSKGAQSHAKLEGEKIKDWIERNRLSFEIRDVTIEDAVQRDQIVAHARMADLTVLTQPTDKDRARRALAEEILFKSGRPVLLVPERPQSNLERVVVAWKPSAQSVRAVAAAMPLLAAAKQVTVVTVDAKPSAAGHAQAPGRELALHLARHGVQVEVRNAESAGLSDADALLAEAAGVQADVLVLGAFGHSRAQETVFGGVTRDLLAGAPLALLMMH